METQSQIPAMLHDKEERMAARRVRRELRNAGKKGDAGDGAGKKGKADIRKEESVSERQISDSKLVLEREHRVGNDRVTAVRVGADDREATRRIKEEDDRQLRRQKQLEEAQLSSKRNAAVAMTWNALYEQNIPQDLQAALDDQKAKCDQIAASKDALIRDLNVEIRVKDDEYTKALQQQKKDISLLLQAMNTMFESLHREHGREIHQVENAFMQERQMLVDKNASDIETLLDKRRNMEIQFMEERAKRVEADQTALEATRTQDAEEYNVLKIKLETEIQGLQQQLEEMRATYLLNSEQLLFNYRVLKQREAETNTTKSMQKKKLTRLQDVQSGLMAKYQKTDREYRQINMDLTEEYKRVTEQYKDLQAKLKHFETGDRKKYRDVWDLNQTTARNIVEKLLQADKIIHEHQLDLVWQPPAEDVFAVEKRAAMDFLRDVESGDVAAEGTADGEAGTADDGGDAEAGPGGDDAPSTPITTTRAHRHESGGAGSNRQLVRKVMDLLCQEAAFMIDDRTKEAIEAEAPENRNLLRVDAVLKALGIETEEHVEKLLTYFVKDAETGELIPQSGAAHAVRQFVEDHQQTLNTKPRSSTKSRQSSRQAVDKREQYANKYQVEEFWKRVEGVIPERTEAVWNALETALERYNSTLHERGKLMDETIGLRQQNEQLKALLNQYLQSKINDELHVPPTQLLTMQQLQQDPARM